MVDEIFNTGSTVKDFISDFYGGLEDGLKEKGLITCKESEAHSIMELNVIDTGETSKGGGIRIFNALHGEIKGIKSNTESQKFKIFVKKPSEVEGEEEKARIEVAKKIQNYPHQGIPNANK